MAAAAILDFKKTAAISLVFDHQNSSQKLVKHWDFDLKHIDDVRNAY